MVERMTMTPPMTEPYPPTPIDEPRVKAEWHAVAAEAVFDAAQVREYGSREAVDKLITALCAASLNFSDPKKSATGQSGNQKYPYAPLTELRNATKPHLLKEGLILLQYLTGPTPDGNHRLTTQLRGHGARLEAVLEFEPMNLTSPENVKAWGSLTTYLRRYAYQAILQLDGDVDADENPGDGNRNKPKSQGAPPREPPAVQGKVQQNPRQSRQDAPRGRSEPPPRPNPTRQEKPSQKPAQASPDFRARVKAGQAKWGKPEVRQAPDDLPPRKVDPHPDADPRQTSIPGSFGPEDFRGSDEGSHLMNSKQGRGETPTKQIPKPEPKPPPVVEEKSNVDMGLVAKVDELTRQLKLNGDALSDWVRARVNKEMDKVNNKDLEFLIEAAEEELRGEA